ncbi:MAG: biopolymer transporter ExbD [Woeseiaceae bacterium]|nr:biopolymer transporter ExbD [Woeseiaceae bacterium]
MRKDHTQEEEENEINLTPMLDVVFIMLIFFIVTASFIKEPGIDVNRTDAFTAVKMPKANILIAINAADEIWVDKKQIDARNLRGKVEQLLAENPKGSVVIQADNESTHEALTLVMQACKQAGVGNVAVSALD